MKASESSYLNIGRPLPLTLALTLALLIALILGGNGLVILQFERAQSETDRLTGVSQKLIAVLRLQETLLLFRQQLSDLVQTGDANRLVTESAPLRAVVLAQMRQTKNTLAYLPQQIHGDPEFLTAVNAIEVNLPQELADITALAGRGDMEGVRLRLDVELKPMEILTAALVKSMDRDLDRELPRAFANMTMIRRRVRIIVPATAVSTVLIAAFFGWVVTRRVILLRTEERVNERTRIARDLHDTLLQSFQGVLLKFHSVKFMIRNRPDEAEAAIDRIGQQGREAIVEGRNTVAGLRSSTEVTNDLAQAIGSLGDDLRTGASGQGVPEFHVDVEGESRELAPLVRDEIYRITGEALRNSFQHAAARRIHVEIHYRKKQILIVVQDDGISIQKEILEQGSRTGHHGLPGMRERARLAGGKLEICSEPGVGTRITLSIPGTVGYAK